MKTVRRAEAPLKFKIFLSLGSAVFILIITAGCFALTILHYQFRRLAENQIRDKTEMRRLVELNADWGAWDETYQFVQGRNPQYITNNLTPSSFATLDLYMLAYYDRAGNLFYAASYDPATQRISPPDNQLLQKISQAITNAELRKYLISGVLSVINDEPYLVSAESILTSQHQGPLQGWILMVRKLNLKSIMDLTKITIEIRPADAAQICLLASHLGKEALVIRAEKDKIIAQQKFYDVLNQKMNVVNILEVNEIMHQGWRTVLYIIGTILFSSLITFFIIIVLLDTAIIKPIIDISEQLIGMDLKKYCRKDFGESTQPRI